jgi:hypothetical protein
MANTNFEGGSGGDSTLQYGYAAAAATGYAAAAAAAADE